MFCTEKGLARVPTHTGRPSRYALLLVGSCTLLSVLAVGSISAFAKLPVYDGDMSFPAIQGPSDPGEYSWEVTLGTGQALRSIDEQHAEVYYTEGEITAIDITAQAAHDAVGSTVPTSLEVSGSNVITLVVHHRAGNPATGGAPFAYPVLPGPGWEGGFHTEIVAGPKDEAELREERERIAREEREKAARQEREAVEGNGGAIDRCVVPKLKGWSLKATKKRLVEADCKIGEVRSLNGITAKTGKVVGQSPRPGMVRSPGTTVKVTLG